MIQQQLSRLLCIDCRAHSKWIIDNRIWSVLIAAIPYFSVSFFFGLNPLFSFFPSDFFFSPTLSSVVATLAFFSFKSFLIAAFIAYLLTRLLFSALASAILPRSVKRGDPSTRRVDIMKQQWLIIMGSRSYSKRGQPPEQPRRSFAKPFFFCPSYNPS